MGLLLRALLCTGGNGIWKAAGVLRFHQGGVAGRAGEIPEGDLPSLTGQSFGLVEAEAVLQAVPGPSPASTACFVSTCGQLGH